MSQKSRKSWWLGVASLCVATLAGVLFFHSGAAPRLPLLITGLGRSAPEQPTQTTPATLPAKPTEQQTPATSATQPPQPANLVYTVAKGESLPAILRRYLPETTSMTMAELEAAVREANPQLGKGLYPKPGTEITIPNYLKMPWVEKPVALDKSFEVRAVYLTGTMAGSVKGQEIIRQWRAVGGNAVVFDLKDSDGILNVPFEHELAPRRNNVPLHNLAKFTRFLHQQNMRAIARIAIFRDEQMARNHPELAVISAHTGEPWKENGKLVWTDPSRHEVWDYNIGLARYAAENGADEVQFDYVRFPAEGDQKDAHFAFQDEHKDWKRADVISAFLQKAHEALQKEGVLFSLDVFGVMAWERPVDLSHTGQDIARMARECDVLSPMIYPSHFYGMDGYELPGDAPEHFISESMLRFQKTTEGSGVVLRPWLQAFGWRTKTYSADYIRTQVETAKKDGGVGFLFWNARNDYDKPLAAMPEMKAAGDRYFRGDEVDEALKKQGERNAGAAPADSKQTK